MSEPRPARSRKDRPCDYCRRLKHSCRIDVRGEACGNCRKTNRECTFAAPSRGKTNMERPLPEAQLKLAKMFNTFSDVVSSSNAKLRQDDDDEYASLDGGDSETEESHYLGAGAFMYLTMDPPPSHTAAHVSPGHDDSRDLVYRQVGEPSRPVYFLQNPSRVYGLSNVQFAAEKAWKNCQDILQDESSDTISQLVKVFLDRILPALPILDRGRFEASCNPLQSSGQFPHTILIGVVTLASVHVPTLRRYSQDLWGVVLNLLDNEYRQPRLQTLQLALLDIYGRPVLNPGGNHLAIGRAIAAAQLLGLHRDSVRWRLPKWERSLRQRLWWCLYNADKWNALVYGRPFNIPRSHNVLLPSHDENNLSIPEVASNEAFILDCRAGEILGKILSMDEDRSPPVPEIARIATVVDEICAEISRLPQTPGRNSLRLSGMGLQMMVCRIAFDQPSLNSQLALDSSIRSISTSLNTFLAGLTSDDYGSFWQPASSYQLTNMIALLLHHLHRLHQRGLPTQSVSDILDTTCAILLQPNQASWEVAEVALHRVRILINSAVSLPGVQEIATKLNPQPVFPALVQPEFNWANAADDLGAWFSLGLDETWLNNDIIAALLNDASSSA